MFSLTLFAPASSHEALVFCSFTGESMDPDGSLAFAYYKEGASQPTFLFPKYALKEAKC